MDLLKVADAGPDVHEGLIVRRVPIARLPSATGSSRSPGSRAPRSAGASQRPALLARSARPHGVIVDVIARMRARACHRSARDAAGPEKKYRNEVGSGPSTARSLVVPFIAGPTSMVIPVRRRAGFLARSDAPTAPAVSIEPETKPEPRRADWPEQDTGVKLEPVKG
jgi:hypothetical protein